MPAQLKEVRNRISSVKSTQKITKAMKLVAASKLRKAQERIVKMRPYANKLYDILGNIVSGTEGDVNIEYGNERTPEKILVVVLTSDRGLCGGFNTNMAKQAKQIFAKYSEQREKGNITVLCIGKKGYDALKREENINFINDYKDLFNNLTFEEVANAAEMVMSGFVNQDFDVVEVCYTQFKNQITQIATTEQYLPIQKIDEVTGGNDESKSQNADFIYQPSQAEIIQEIVPKILKTQFFRYLLDSNASEHGSRMTAMENATQNAEDLLRDLKIMYNRARQAAITTELTEIVSGAAALQGS